jgi:hypothetical protein
MGCACSTYGKDKNAYKIPVGKLEGKNPLGNNLFFIYFHANVTVQKPITK